MPKLFAFSKFLIIYSHKIYIYEPSASSKALYCVDVSLHLQKDPKLSNYVTVDTLQVSPCGQFLVCTVGKELILLSFPDCQPLSHAKIEKTASSVKFFHKQDVVLIADRSGSVTFFKYTDGNLTKENIILGHNSMLTDALVAPSDEVVITADRDEKIRVSRYPNVYNIENFCMGHEMFVSSICFHPTDHRLLLSSSGDRSIRIWDYISGTELSKIDLLDSEGAIRKIICRAVDGETEVAVQRHKTSDIVLLSLLGDFKTGFKLAVKEKITTSEIVLDVTFCGSLLYYVVDVQKDMLRVWPEEGLDNTKLISKNLADEISLTNVDSYDVLFKRNIDNVQEYQERKKARLMQKGSD